MNMTTTVDIDVPRLEAYLLEHVEGLEGPIQVERFSDGQSNPTYAITDRNLNKYVLRKKPGGHLLPSAHAIEREYRVMTALHNTDVPVPRTFCLCIDGDVIGTPFFVMEFVTGRIPWAPALPGMTPCERGDIYSEMNRVVAALLRRSRLPFSAGVSGGGAFEGEHSAEFDVRRPPEGEIRECRSPAVHGQSEVTVRGVSPA